MKPRAIILRAAGTNCDAETAHAFELAGAESSVVHINRVIETPAALDEFQILAFPGGFSHGDDISAGKIFAHQLVNHLREPLLRFRDAGKPIIGICNGFQVLVKAALLPGPFDGQGGQNATLTCNDCARYVDRWVRLAARSAKCVWTAGLREFDCPVAHGEGKFVPASEEIRRGIWADDRAALVYVKPDGSPAQGQFPHNPNGSTDDIAGLCDATGLIFGLMPHPERYLWPLQHPAWTSLPAGSDEGPGLQVFRNAVRHVGDAVGAGV